MQHYLKRLIGTVISTFGFFNFTYNAMGDSTAECSVMSTYIGGITYIPDKTKVTITDEPTWYVGWVACDGDPDKTWANEIPDSFIIKTFNGSHVFRAPMFYHQTYEPFLRYCILPPDEVAFAHSGLMYKPGCAVSPDLNMIDHIYVEDPRFFTDFSCCPYGGTGTSSSGGTGTSSGGSGYSGGTQTCDCYYTLAETGKTIEWCGATYDLPGLEVKKYCYTFSGCSNNGYSGTSTADITKPYCVTDGPGSFSTDSEGYYAAIGSNRDCYVVDYLPSGPQDNHVYCLTTGCTSTGYLTSFMQNRYALYTCTKCPNEDYINNPVSVPNEGYYYDFTNMSFGDHKAGAGANTCYLEKYSARTNNGHAFEVTCNSKYE